MLLKAHSRTQADDAKLSLDTLIVASCVANSKRGASIASDFRKSLDAMGS